VMDSVIPWLPLGKHCLELGQDGQDGQDGQSSPLGLAMVLPVTSTSHQPLPLGLWVPP
jgi:hypothetical protein